MNSFIISYLIIMIIGNIFMTVVSYRNKQKVDVGIFACFATYWAAFLFFII